MNRSATINHLSNLRTLSNVMIAIALVQEIVTNLYKWKLIAQN